MIPDRVREGLSAALEDDRPLLRPEDFEQMLESGNAQLWTGEKSWIFTRITPYASGEIVLDGGPAGGDLAEILQGIDHIEARAREAGVTQIHITSSRAWSRILKSRGYAEMFTVTRKTL